jgi:NifU-like protein involved in Fe-S cluster formation
MPLYSDAVRDYFGREPKQPGGDATGEAGSMERGTWLQFGADISDGRLSQVGFRAFACPHIIAACQRVAELLEGAPIEALEALNPEEIQQEFEIPVDKAGKLLILMDALSACRERIARRSA